MWEEVKDNAVAAGLIARNLPVFLRFSDKPEEFVTFPYSILMTQPCDIDSYFKVIKQKSSDEDYSRQIITHVIFTPAFDEEKFKAGTHLRDQYGYKVESMKSGDIDAIKGEKRERFQYLKSNRDNIPHLFIDFKHYFTIPIEIVINIISQQYEKQYKLDHLYYTKLADRFAHYLQRVALP